MAIVKMKKLRVMAMAEQRDELLQELLHLGCVEISEPTGKLSDPEWAALLKRESSRLVSTKNEITDVNVALAAIKKYGQLKDGMFIQRHPISEQEFLGTDTVERARAVSQSVGQQLQNLTRLQNEESRLIARKASLQPWMSLDMPLEQEGSQNVVYRMGVCPAGTDSGEIKQALGETATELYEISADRQQTYYLLMCHKADEQAVMEILRPRNFSAVTFAGVTGTAAENVQALELTGRMGDCIITSGGDVHCADDDNRVGKAGVLLPFRAHDSYEFAQALKRREHGCMVNGEPLQVITAEKLLGQ